MNVSSFKELSSNCTGLNFSGQWHRASERRCAQEGKQRKESDDECGELHGRMFLEWVTKGKQKDSGLKVEEEMLWMVKKGFSPRPLNTLWVS